MLAYVLQLITESIFKSKSHPVPPTSYASHPVRQATSWYIAPPKCKQRNEVMRRRTGSNHHESLASARPHTDDYDPDEEIRTLIVQKKVQKHMIPKPPIEPGRPRRGGYSLDTIQIKTLGWAQNGVHALHHYGRLVLARMHRQSPVQTSAIEAKKRRK